MGDPFDPAELDRSLKNLFATGLFDDVSLRREGDRLIVAVVENPIINRIAFEGNRRLDDETLESELQLRPRVVYTRSRVQNAVSRILELYRRNGRFAATVEPKVIELPQNRVDLVFEINEGPLTKVARIVFIGNQAFDDDDLRSVIQTKEAAWYRFLSSDDTYDPDRVAFDQELLRRFYLARGYADFNVRSAIAELTPDGERFVVTFTVEEGERYDFGKIGLESRIPDLEPEQLRELLKTKQGDIYNADEIEDSIVALTEEIGELGYAFAQVEPVPTKHEAEHTIDLTYAINEGSRVYIERIDIVGNVRTLDEVIRREFRVSEGDAFNTALLRRSRQRIENLGYFEKVEINTLPGSSPDKTRIEVKVSERSTGELSFGAGYSTSDGPLGDIRLTERNFLGRGQSIQANFTISGAHAGDRPRLHRALFSGPRGGGGLRSVPAQHQLPERGLVRPADHRRHPAGELSAHRALAPRRAADRARGRDPQRRQRRLAIHSGRRRQRSDGSARPGPDLRYPRYALSAFRWLHRAAHQDVADFGADTQFLRVEGRGSYYYPFYPDWVLNVAGRAGYIFGLGEDVRLFDRFFLGGASFRGFKFAGVGPRDTSTGDALGGNLLYTGTVEQRFPLGLPEELRIFGRGFVEAGSLVDPDVSGPTVFDSSALRASAGGGLSWLSPLGPISIDLAQAFLKEDEDETELFRISFGTRF